jgi:hypothetical protein
VAYNPRAGLYLTDVTFCREGNPNFRASPANPDKKLLNFNKYHKLARIVQGKSQKSQVGTLSDLLLDMQRFQVPYNLKEIPEVQQYLNGAFENAKHHGDLQDLYRRRFVSISANHYAPLKPSTVCLLSLSNPPIRH